MSKFRGCRGTKTDTPHKAELKWISCTLNCDLGYGSKECKDFRRKHKAIIECKELPEGDE